MTKMFFAVVAEMVGMISDVGLHKSHPTKAKKYPDSTKL